MLRVELERLGIKQNIEWTRSTGNDQFVEWLEKYLSGADILTDDELAV